MMQHQIASAILCSTLLVSGCAGLLNQYVSQYGGLIAADKLSPVVQIPVSDKGDPVYLNFNNLEKNQYLTYIVLEAYDSLSKCKKLLDSQGIVSRGIDADLDLITTVLTALATAFTPVQTIHALTAAALITSGWKSALDNDLYAKKTADIIATQIDSSYFLAMDDYVKDLSKRVSLGGVINPQLEFLRITLVHRQCSIDLALGALAQKAKVGDLTASTSDKITIEDLKNGKPLPGKLPGGPWSVVAVTPPVVLLKQGSERNPHPYEIDGLLKILNASE